MDAWFGLWRMGREGSEVRPLPIQAKRVMAVPIGKQISGAKPVHRSYDLAARKPSRAYKR